MHMLYRRFMLVAAFVAAMGVLTSIVIQETRNEAGVTQGEPSALDCRMLRNCGLETGRHTWPGSMGHGIG